jgi:hypothetical protein
MACPILKQLEIDRNIAKNGWEHFYGSDIKTRSWKKHTKEAREKYDEATERIRKHQRICEACKE